MKTLRFIGLLALLLCLVACSKGNESEEPTPSPTPTPTPSAPTITIDNSIITNGLSFTDGASDKSITFTTDADWTLSVAETRAVEWCTSSATSGVKGTATVTFSVTENTGYDNRKAAVTIKAGSTSKTFTISQKQKDALLITTDKYELEQVGGEIEVEVKANIDYQIEIAEEAKSWISENTTRALTAKKHAFTIAPSEEYEKREGEIYVKSGDKQETVKVYQSGGAILLLSQNEYVVSDAGETITVDIKSNFEYGVQLPDVDWISEVTDTRAASSHTLKYDIAPNETYDNRTAEIIFFDKNSDLKEIVKIEQKQHDALLITTSKYELNQVGGEIEVEIKTNIDYQIEVAEDAKSWISENTTRALTDKKHLFSIAKNEGTKERIGEIHVKSDKKQEIIKIYQSINYRTILAYVVADNSLNYFFESDFNEMLVGIQNVDTDINNMIIYVDDNKMPKLYRIYKNKNGTIKKDIIHEYNEQISTTPEVMKEVCEKVFADYPAQSYGLIYWSHGEGWKPMPQTSSTRWVGQDKSGEMTDYTNIDELKNVLESSVPHLDFLLYDACFMMSIEASYALRDEVDYIIASPTEIPGPGAPYNTIIPIMFKEGNTAVDIANAYFNAYNQQYNDGVENSDSHWSAGVSISVLKTSALSTLAHATNQAIRQATNIDINTLKTKIFDYDKRPPYSSSKVGYYDMVQLIKNICLETNFLTWKSAFDDAMVYYQTTPMNYSSYSGLFSMNGTYGLTHFLPGSNQSLNESYATTEWYSAALLFQ